MIKDKMTGVKAREERQFEIRFPYLTLEVVTISSISWHDAVRKAAEKLGLTKKYTMSSLYKAASYSILDNKRKRKRLYDL
jgi:hypothetical protein